MKTAHPKPAARRALLFGQGVHWENWSRKCSNQVCRTSPLKAVFGGKGLQIFDDWFCGPECVEHALASQFADLCRSLRPAETRRAARVPLGLMLFSRGYLSEEQFKAALEAHRNCGGRVGDIALQLGFVSEEQVAAALAGQWNYPVYSFKNAPLQLPAIAPLHLMALHQMLPIQFIEDTGRLLVGFATRVEHAVIYAMEKILGCPTAPCFITASDFRSRMQALESQRSADELVLEQTSSAREMASIVCHHALHNEASEIRFAICREYLWARTLGPQQPFDLLFKLETSQP